MYLNAVLSIAQNIWLPNIRTFGSESQVHEAKPTVDYVVDQVSIQNKVSLIAVLVKGTVSGQKYNLANLLT